MEEWRPIPLPEFDRYLVSSQGRVARIMVPAKPGGRYRRYCGIRLTLTNGGGRTTGIHRLVAMAFIGLPPSPKYQVNHKNFDPSDNQPENLEWVLPIDNGNRSRKLTETEVREIDAAQGRGMARPLAARYGVSIHLIKRIWSHDCWKSALPPRGPRRPNPRGSNNGNALLTEEQVRAIKHARGSLQGTTLAAQYGVSTATISAIWRGQNWAWLPDAPPPMEAMSQKGEHNPAAKLSEESVRAIRGAQGVIPRKALATQYHVSPLTISAIWHRRLWAWLV